MGVEVVVVAGTTTTGGDVAPAEGWDATGAVGFWAVAEIEADELPPPPAAGVWPKPDEARAVETIAEAIVIVLVYRLISTEEAKLICWQAGIAVVEVVATFRPIAVDVGMILGDARLDELVRLAREGWWGRDSVALVGPSTSDGELGNAIAKLETGQIASRAIEVGRNGRSLRGRAHVSIHPRKVCSPRYLGRPRLRGERLASSVFSGRVEGLGSF